MLYRNENTPNIILGREKMNKGRSISGGGKSRKFFLLKKIRIRRGQW